MKKVKIVTGTVLFVIAMFALMAAPAFADTYYTVKSGDCLWNIANTTGVSVSQIKSLNGLVSNMIYPGQSLLIAKDGEKSPAPTAIEVSRGNNRIEEILTYAESFIGTPYRYGGQSPQGFDCSGFVRYVFGDFGISLSHNAQAQYNETTAISESETRPGDLVFFSDGSGIFHSGILLGNGKFISSTSNYGIQITPVYGPFWGTHLYGYSRVIP